MVADVREGRFPALTRDHYALPMTFHLNYAPKPQPPPKSSWESYIVVGVSIVGVIAGLLLVGLGLPLIRALF